MKKFTSIFHEAEIPIGEANILSLMAGALVLGRMLDIDKDKSYYTYMANIDAKQIIKKIIDKHQTNEKILKVLNDNIRWYNTMINDAKKYREKAPDTSSDVHVTHVMAAIARNTVFDQNYITSTWTKKQWDESIRKLEKNKKIFESEAKKYSSKVQKESYLDFDLL